MDIVTKYYWKMLQSAFFKKGKNQKFNQNIDHQATRDKKLSLKEDSDEKNLFRKSVQEIKACIPFCLLDENLYKTLPIVEYKNLTCSDEKSDAILWVHKMQAGVGSSIKRDRYLKGKALGSKGTDLFLKLENGENLGLAKCQMLRAFKEAKKGCFKKIYYQDLVSRDTQEAISKLWEEFFQEIKENKVDSFSRLNVFLQEELPLFDKKKFEFSSTKKACAGHGFFALYLLLSCLDESLRPHVDARDTLIACLSNGEDVNAFATPRLTNFMMEKNIAVLILTTTKTKNDLKGGQFCVDLSYKDGPLALSILELAQAKELGILDEFYEWGLSLGERSSFFNTNMVLVNFKILVPLLKELISKIGMEAFLKGITPELILKESESYIQLEMALGPMFLKLDTLLKRELSKSVLTLLNLDETQRGSFFTPVKSAMDFYLLFYSNLFILDSETLRLCKKTRNDLPSFKLHDPWYDEVAHVLEAFEGVNIDELESLEVHGKVCFKGLTLKGKLSIESSLKDFVNLRKSPYLEGKITNSTLENLQLKF